MWCRSGNDVHLNLYKSSIFVVFCMSYFPIVHEYATPSLRPRKKMFACITFFPFLYATPIYELVFVKEDAPRNVIGFIFRFIALRVYGSSIIYGSDVDEVLFNNFLTSPLSQKIYLWLFRSPFYIGHLLTTWSGCPRTQGDNFFFTSEVYTTSHFSWYLVVWVCICSWLDCFPFWGIIFY